MTGISKINLKATFQYFLIVAIVFLVGVWMRAKAGEERNLEKPSTETYTYGLPFKGVSIEEYPEVNLGSEKAWKKYLKNVTSENIQFEGEGYIDNDKVSLNCVLLDNGQLIGRYHNYNGTNLDLNGYIVQESGKLKIHLGHSSNKTLSNWYLTPEVSESTNGTFVYEGTWGKKNLPSKLIFKQIYN